jgi:hypothetical protein
MPEPILNLVVHRRRTQAIALALAAVIAMAATADAPHALRPIVFAPGTSTATIEQGLERGASDTYRFDARAGQLADVRITSIETNASFSIYRPPARATPSADGSGYDISGTTLKGRGPADAGLDPGAEKHWAGKLPASGRYYISVATDRGNATYRLTVTIR